MAKSDLQMRFIREGFLPNGTREMSSTTDIDAGFANKILDVFSGVVADSRRASKPFKDFLKRSGRDQLKFGDFDDVELLLKAARRANAGRRDDLKLTGVNPDALPIINLGRKPGFQMHDNSTYIDLDDAGYCTNENGEPKALFTSNPIELTYSIMVIAAEKETLNLMLSVLAAWMRQFTNRANTQFITKTRIAGCAIDLECSTRDPKAVIIEDLSPPITHERIFAAAIPVTVVAPLLTAWHGKPHKGKIEVVFDGVGYRSKDPLVGDD